MNSNIYLRRRKPRGRGFNPWTRRQPTRYGPYEVKGNHFGRFDDYVEKNKDLDLATKNAALQASPYVVRLTSYVGIQRLFICSGTIISSYEANGVFCNTILTSASLLRCSEDDDATLPDDLKVEVHVYDCGLVEGEILGFDFHYNVAAIMVKTGERVQSAPVGNADDAWVNILVVLRHSNFSPIMRHQVWLSFVQDWM